MAKDKAPKTIGKAHQAKSPFTVSQKHGHTTNYCGEAARPSVKPEKNKKLVGGIAGDGDVRVCFHSADNFKSLS
jgi:hypothetical protein